MAEATSATPRGTRLVPIAVAAAASLVVAAWAGLSRLGLEVGGAPTSAHGPLMVLGFLGTVISLERAVGLDRSWAWVAPVTSAAGAFLLLLGWFRPGAILAIVAGIALTAVYVAAVSISGREAHLIVMGAGAVAWVVGATGLALGASVPATVPALAGFLVLTICGERLELSRMGRPRSPGWRRLVVGSAAAVAIATVAGLVDLTIGSRLFGIGVVVLALASAAGDIARRTIRASGVTRYMAVALLSGYAWLVVAGLVWSAGGLAPGTGSYDVALHALFVGFVLSMVFGHAPVIVPAVAGVDLPFHPSWWAPLALLHGSLLIRVLGTALGSPTVRAWGGSFNVVALTLFIGLAASSAWRARRAERPAPV